MTPPSDDGALGMAALAVLRVHDADPVRADRTRSRAHARLRAAKRERQRRTVAASLVVAAVAAWVVATGQTVQDLMRF